MIVKTYAIYDEKTKVYRAPHYQLTRGQAIREFMDAVNDDKSPYAKHPEDYTLFELGEYDDGAGQFQNHATPISVGTALEMRNPLTN